MPSGGRGSHRAHPKAAGSGAGRGAVHPVARHSFAAARELVEALLGRRAPTPSGTHPVEHTTPPKAQPAQPARPSPRRRYTRRVTRRELIDRTRQLVEEGERIVAAPSLSRLRLWLKVSDDLLSAAWGTMDRYHLAWLMVGRPTDVARGRPLTPAEEATYVREVARAKTAALRTSLDALERLGIPFLGEDPEPSRPGPSRPEPGRP
jgi:hypothetical protein